MSAAAAESALGEAGFEATYRGATTPGNSHLEQWTVNSQEPAPGEAAGPEGEVKLWASTPITTALYECGTDAEPGDGGTSVVLDMRGEDYGTGDLTITNVMCVLDALEVPDSVKSEMQSTRALDGRQTGSWAGIDATWSYHPDSGLDVIVEMTN